MSEPNESAEPHEAGRARPNSGSDHAVLRHTLRVVLALALVLYFIVATLVLGLRYAVLPNIDSFRPRIEAVVSSKLHAQLNIGQLAPHWTGFQPGLDITNVTIRDSDGNTALTIPHATATLSWRSFLQFAPVLSTLIVDKPDVLIARGTDGVLSVAGVPLPTRHTGSDTFTTWLLRQQAIVLRGGTLRWRDARHDAPEIKLHDIRLAILTDGSDHRLALQAPAEGNVLHGPLDFRANFRHAPLSAAGKPINWKGHAYLSTGPVDLPTLARYIDFPVETFAGRIDNSIWIDFAEGRMTSAGGHLAGANVSMRVRPTQPKLDLPVADFIWNVDLASRDFKLQLSDLHAELGQPPLDDGTPVTRSLTLSTLNGRFRMPSVQHGQLISINGDRVDLGILAEFSRALPLPRKLLNELVRFNPRGMVANYVIEVERDKPDSGEAAAEHRPPGAEPIVRYRFKGDLQGISVAAQEPPPGLTLRNHPRAGIPGVENLWGSVDADENHGAVTIDTAKVAVTLPGVFDDPRLLFDRMTGHGHWEIRPAARGEQHKAFSVVLSDLAVANADTAATVTANYTNPGHGRGALDLKAVFDRAKVPQIPRYLPTSISEKLRLYLGHGLQGGTSQGATIEVHGNLDKFPYSRDPTAGVFHIVAPFRGGRFEPSPWPPRTLKDGTPSVWPAFDGIDGKFELKENVLRFDVDRAHYKRVALGKVTGKIDDLGTRASNLVITGDGRGPLADLLDYVNNSALGGISKHAGGKVRAEGPATLALKLTVPRTPKPHIAVDGTIGFQNNTLVMEKAPPLSRLNGKLRFTEHTAQTDRLSAHFLGGDVHASGGYRQDGTYAFDIAGRIGVDAAQGLNLRGPATQVLAHMSGSAPYQMSIQGARGRSPDVTASSDLTGLALNFPAPFNKPMGEPMPLRFTFRPPLTGAAGGASRSPRSSGSSISPAASASSAGPADAGLQRADLTFGPVAATYLLRHDPKQPLTVVRGAIGVNKPADLPLEGVTATADVEQLDADAWRALISQMRSGSKDAIQPGVPNTTAQQFLPTRFAIHIGTLTLLKRHWDDLVVGASRDAGRWQANIGSNQVSGHVSWLPGATKDSPGTLQARFAKLVIPSATEKDLLGRAMSVPAQNMPSIDLIVNELIVRERNLGRLEVDAHNFDEDGVPVWQLDKLDISNPAATLTATANWRTDQTLTSNSEQEAPRRTALDFKLDIKDAGALLERAGLAHTIKAGSGTLSGKLVWLGGPTVIDYPTLDGTLAVDLRHGQILKVDPGVAKLLGVISLQSLAHYATLNFRDVIGEGLPFESVTGTAKIDNGVGRTDNFEMVLAPARANMKGTVDLAHETEDLRVHVTPTVSAGAGVVVAAVINPLFGLGALLADFALSQSIEHAFAMDYAITGPWAKPHIERVRVDRGKMNTPVPAAVE
ncbi:YhdP family protein [Paraburkholderia sp. GAS334]|uniref:YhdP family phospholipid transporter n=1 Tax=Paraburkholderia sp. GAS334 TaxID=3035131 RepID=UPI003D1965B3